MTFSERESYESALSQPALWLEGQLVSASFSEQHSVISIGLLYVRCYNCVSWHSRWLLFIRFRVGNGGHFLVHAQLLSKLSELMSNLHIYRELFCLQQHTVFILFHKTCQARDWFHSRLDIFCSWGWNIFKQATQGTQQPLTSLVACLQCSIHRRQFRDKIPISWHFADKWKNSLTFPGFPDKWSPCVKFPKTPYHLSTLTVLLHYLGKLKYVHLSQIIGDGLQLKIYDWQWHRK